MRAPDAATQATVRLAIKALAHENNRTPLHVLAAQPPRHLRRHVQGLLEGMTGNAATHLDELAAHLALAALEAVDWATVKTHLEGVRDALHEALLKAARPAASADRLAEQPALLDIIEDWNGSLDIDDPDWQGLFRRLSGP